MLNKEVNTKLELEDFNFGISSKKWKIEENNGIKYKINPEGDITEFLEGEYKGEQLFTWGACMRETEKKGKKIPTDEEFNLILSSRKDLKTIIYTGSRSTDGVAFGNCGYIMYLGSSTPSAGNAYVRDLYWNSSSVFRSVNNQALGFSVRCLKD